MWKQNLLLCAVISVFVLQAITGTMAADADETPIVAYTIHVRLDPETKQLHASEVIQYTNRSTSAIPDLYFHLYLNAFKNEKSTFIREQGGRMPRIVKEKDEWGWIDIQRLSIDGADALAGLEYVQPDDHNPDDQTVARTPLSSPLLPGACVTVEIEFTAQLPRVFRRTGYRKDYFFVAQWFPKLGVWEPIGRRGRTQAGWNCHQYHNTTEFYADFGRYDVWITLPNKFIVGATGSETGRSQQGEQTTLHFEADRVIDFTWTASPYFLREERMFRMADWVTPAELQQVMTLHGVTQTEAALPDLKMILLLQPEHKAQADRHFRALALAVKYFGLWYGPYPYPTITLVDPAWSAGGSGGMEYPRLIAGGTSWLAPQDSFNLGPEGVTVHEFGHQYWQTLVASNEFEDAWLDEGFTTYSAGRIMDLAYSQERLYFPFNEIFIPMDPWISITKPSENQMSRMGMIVERGQDQIAREGWKYYNHISYTLNSYSKTAAVLYQLQNELGEDAMARVMRTYFQRWRFNHPGAQDFIAAAEEISGRDLDWFFNQLLFGAGYLDYVVAEASSDQIAEAAGVFDTPQGRITRSSREIEQERKKHQKDEAEQDLYHTRVTIRNEGTIRYPVEILVRFKDGEEIREHWDGDYRWVRYEYDRPSELERVMIDPEAHLVIDVNRANNSWVAEPRLCADLRWSLYLLFMIQNLFNGL